jgi:hypothetical protein
LRAFTLNILLRFGISNITAEEIVYNIVQGWTPPSPDLYPIE